MAKAINKPAGKSGNRPGDKSSDRPSGKRRDRDQGGPPSESQEVVLQINRCAKVVKGGRRFSFSALVVTGDRSGRVGVGLGKGNEVAMAVEKGTKAARRAMTRVAVRGTTIPHGVWGRFGAAKVHLIPAYPGTGVIAGATTRAVVELAGVKDILTKAFGSTNKINLAKAAFNALTNLQNPEEVARLRGVELDLPPKGRMILRVEAERNRTASAGRPQQVPVAMVTPAPVQTVPVLPETAPQDEKGTELS